LFVVVLLRLRTRRQKEEEFFFSKAQIETNIIAPTLTFTLLQATPTRQQQQRVARG
jgi:hypothetical protein